MAYYTAPTKMQGGFFSKTNKWLSPWISPKMEENIQAKNERIKAEEAAKNPQAPQNPNAPTDPYDEIIGIVRDQIRNYKPVQYPREVMAATGLGQLGALGANLVGLTAQRTEEKPFIPNPGDVNAAFRKLPTDVTTNVLDNFYLKQQRSMLNSLQTSGATPYDMSNIMAKPMADASASRSSAAYDTLQRNADLDRQRAGFNMEIDRGITAARNQELMNENMKTAAIAQKTAEGIGQRGNLLNQGMEKMMQMEALNNAKMSSLMNTLFTVNYLKKLNS